MQHINSKKHIITKKLGEIVKDIRISQTKLSCSKFADEYDLDRGNLNRIENGLIDSKFTTIWQLAEGLGMKTSDLVIILEKKLGEDFKLIDE